MDKNFIFNFILTIKNIGKNACNPHFCAKTGLKNINVIIFNKDMSNN
jgi:hypothetical protein